MSDQARITSIDALEAFRAELIRYIGKSRSALDEVAGEVHRTQAWLDVDRRVHWDNEVRRRTKQLEQAEQELYSAQLSTLKESNAPQKLAVMKARRLLAEAEEKVRVVKRWRNNFDNRAGFLLRQLDPMWFRIGQQLPQAVHLLAESIKALQDYAETHRPPQAAAPEAAPAAAPHQEDPA